MQNFTLDYIKSKNKTFFDNARFHDYETYKIINKKGEDLFIVTYDMYFSDGSGVTRRATYKITYEGFLEHKSSEVLKTMTFIVG